MRLVLLLLAVILCCASCSGSDSDPTGTGAPAPDPVTDLRVTAGEAGAVTLSWTSPDIGSVRYEMRRIAYDQISAPFEAWTAAGSPSGDGGGQEREYRVGGLVAGETYAFRLRVARGEAGGWSEPSNHAVGTADPEFDRTRPAAVPRIVRYAGTDTSLTVGFLPAGDDSVFGTASSHEVRWSVSPIDAGNWDAATPATEPVTDAGRPGWLQVAVGDLDPLGTYHFAVRGIDDSGHLGAVGASTPLVVQSMRTIYVNVEGTGDVPTIGEAVNMTNYRDIVVVGPGRYTWTNQGTGDPKLGLVQVQRGRIRFLLVSEEGPEKTIIDAEGNGPVFRLTGEPAEVGMTLDGFTLTGGVATGDPRDPEEHDSGGGLIIHLSSSTIRNCIIEGNEAINGGGVWCGGQGTVLFENVIIRDNYADYGGGIHLINSSPRVTFRDCQIVDNEARYGGGMSFWNIRWTIENTLIARNHAVRQGGGMWIANVHAGCEIIGTTIADNFCSLGSAMYIYRVSAPGVIPPSEIKILQERTLITGNTGSAAYAYSLQAGVRARCSNVWGNPVGDNRPTFYEDAGGNFSADPLICERTDYTVAAASPCLPGNHPDGGSCGQVGYGENGCAR